MLILGQVRLSTGQLCPASLEKGLGYKKKDLFQNGFISFELTDFFNVVLEIKTKNQKKNIFSFYFDRNSK